MSDKRQTIRLAVYIIFRNERDEILLIRRANTGWRDGEYTLPAGHVDAGETAVSACIHEAREEVSLEVSEKDLILRNVTQFQQVHSADENYINLFFECKKYLGIAKIGEPNKCDDLVWVKPEKLDEIPVIDSIKFSLEKVLDGEAFASWGL
jgi:8-oxo-dGTP pyrophosphatase MutT (NUDIX family)